MHNGVDRHRGEPLEEKLAGNHGMADQGLVEVEVFLAACGVFGDRKVVNFEAPARITRSRQPSGRMAVVSPTPWA